ncbi:MAG: hypothetical protein ACM3X7_06910 [Solirubrobacterales bacterium]
MGKSGYDAFNTVDKGVQSFGKSALSTVSRVTAGFVSLAAAVKGLKTGFTTAMNYQDSRMTLDALYQNSALSASKFKMATDYANATPWEQSDTVGTLVKLKAYGLDDSKNMLSMMSDLGSAFKGSGQNMQTATEAYADMMNGEWQRMTEFGIKRTTLEQFAKSNNMKAFDNKQGQITDKDALASVFEAFMKAKNYTGMTQKLSETASGKLSTLTGNLKQSLAQLVGISEDGTVRTGSLFDKFIKGMDTFITKMDTFANSAEFDKLSNGLAELGGSIVNAFSYIVEHPDLVSNLLKLGVGLWVFGKVASVVSGISAIAGLFSSTGLIASLAPILAGIAPELLAIAAAGVVFMAAFKGGEFIAKLLDGTTDISSSELQYDTVATLEKNGSITKTDASQSIMNNMNVNMNIDTVKETADIDEVMDTVTKRLDKYSQTRNNLD